MTCAKAWKLFAYVDLQKRLVMVEHDLFLHLFFPDIRALFPTIILYIRLSGRGIAGILLFSSAILSKSQPFIF